MDNIFEKSLLYDFYGELLTEHQKKIYEDFVLNDFSLSEIAECEGISRQGVHDLVKRCNKILNEYESKLCLVAKFLAVKEYVSEIQDKSEEFKNTKNEQLIIDIEEISGRILDEL